SLRKTVISRRNLWHIHLLAKRSHALYRSSPRWLPSPALVQVAVNFRGSRVADRGVFLRLLRGRERKVAPMTVSRPSMTEKLDRLIDDVRVLKAQMIGLDRQLKGIEAYL